MVRRLLAAAALFWLPAIAEAASFSVQNCSAGPIDIAGYNDAREMPWNSPTSSTFAYSKQSGIVQCNTPACLVRIIYGAGEGQSVGFPTAYSADVCTRGIEDRGGQLGAAGTCGC